MEMNLVDKEPRPLEKWERVKNSSDYILDIFGEDLNSSDDDDDDDHRGGMGDQQHTPVPQLEVTHGDEEVDGGVPRSDYGGQLSPNAFAKGIENMENRDNIPTPHNTVNFVRNSIGWLWLGGIQGKGVDIAMAIDGALQELEGEILINLV